MSRAGLKGGGMGPRLREWQVEADVASNSKNKIHQTWARFSAQPCNNRRTEPGSEIYPSCWGKQGRPSFLPSLFCISGLCQNSVSDKQNGGPTEMGTDTAAREGVFCCYRNLHFDLETNPALTVFCGWPIKERALFYSLKNFHNFSSRGNIPHVTQQSAEG